MPVKLLPVELPLLVCLRHIRERAAGTRADRVRRLQLPRHRRDGFIGVADAVGLEALNGTLVVGTLKGKCSCRDLVALLDVLVRVLFAELSDDTTVEVQ